MWPFSKKKTEPQIRKDQWQNPYTGFGTNRDKMMAGTFVAPYRLQDAELLALYNGSDIAARGVETEPQMSMRTGYELKAKSCSDSDLAKLKTLGTGIRCDELVTDAAVWGNVFGGAVLIIGAEDGSPMDQPLAEDRLKDVHYLNVIDRRFAFPHTYYSNPLKPNYGLPESYLIVSAVGGLAGGNGSPASFVVHESRVIRFDGARTDLITRQQLAGWSWSKLQRPYEALRTFDMSFQAVANLMSDASQAVFKINGLIQMIASGQENVLQTRMALVDISRSTARAVLLDAENEDFTRQATSFAGVPDTLDRFMMRLSAAFEIPVTILMGRSAAGMNSTGDSDFRQFYDTLDQKRVRELSPKLIRIYRLLARIPEAKGGLGRDIEDLEIQFHPLWQPSDKEQADTEFITAQKDNLYLQAGVLTPEEVALSRYGKGSFSTETKINTQDREMDQQTEKLLGKPPPDEQLQNAGQQGEQQTGVTPFPGPNGSGDAGFSEAAMRPNR